MKAMFSWSPRTTSSPGTTSVLFDAGTLSPVIADSSIWSDVASMIRPSAQTSSPTAEEHRVADDDLVGGDLDLGPVPRGPGPRS